MEKCDALIVGAGPTGLTMAAELARYGLSCRIIDRSSNRSVHSKALGIQPKTMEVFRMLGLDREFLDRGQPLKALNVLSDQKSLGKIDISPPDTLFPFLLSLPQSQTEEILDHHLQKYQLKVERDCELVGLQETKDKVIARVQKGEQIEEIEAQWVVGCDGAHSFVRKHLHLSFLGNAFPVVFSLADVKIDWKYSHEEVFAIWNTDGVLAVIPLPEKGVYRLIFELPRCQKPTKVTEDNLHVELPSPTLEEVKEIVHKRAGSKATLSNPQWLANFHVNSRLASRYHKGRLFLAGDAAHIHSPIGGQGMNTGIQDAFNLAWKLSFVHLGKATPELLKSYHRERHEIAKTLLRRTEMGTRVAALEKRWKIFLRNVVAASLLKIPPVQKKLIGTMTQLTIRYPESLFFENKGDVESNLCVGTRFPNWEIESEKGVVQTHDFLKGINSFIVICFLKTGRDKKTVTSLTESLESMSLPIKIISLSKEKLDFPTYLDKRMEKEGCCLIRPDGYIGYSQNHLSPQGIISYLKKYTNK